MLLDNKAQRRVADALLEAFSPGSEASILTNDISLFAWDAMRKALGKLAATRLLLSLSAGDGHAVGQSPNLIGGPEERRYRNQLSGPYLARLLDAWLQQSTVEVRNAAAMVPISLFHARNADGSAVAVQGSSAFTAPGLGLTPSERVELNTLSSDSESASSLLGFFEALWTASELAPDAKERLRARLRGIYEPSPPQSIYFQTLFHLFGQNIEELDEDRIVRSRTGIRETLVWKKLYRFQRDGVVGAIDKLERYNGCIIADSVGLGKTFEALAIIKYYELRNDRVLVLAPKRLRDNWTLYIVNDKRNLFAGDRFNYDVLNHTDLTRRSGKSGEINLDTINWGNYDLVVIDESHNFRNNPPRRDGLTRYGRLMRDIIKSGVRTKVLMLSATPVNSRMNDLKNQVAFITEGVDDALFDAGIASVENTLRKAQTLFNQWLRTDTEERTTQSLLDTLNFDYFQLLDLLTIARSRKHIEKYYDLKEVGRFPHRARPINVKADIDTADLFPPLRDVNRDIRRLTLSAYAPLRYVLPHKLEEYSRRYDMEVTGGRSFRQLDREESLIHLMRVNLLKRMESSISSFAQTVSKLLDKVQALLERIDAHDATEIEEMSIEDIDLDSDDFDPYLVGSKVKVLLQDVDRVRWRQDLEEDEELLVALLREARQVDSTRDEKLHQLKALVLNKISNPINEGNRKLIIFTAFADTADYLYIHLAEWARTELGIYSAVVTGRSGSNKTNLTGIRADLGSVLTAFSPISKERSSVDAEATTQLDLLIGTDCISEGQNLQDCDYLINYDIHWNPVRIIQRFGRIDRLGSRNKVIQLVNFWPNMELDEYINLEARVSGRMVLLDISATGEENVIESTEQDQMNDLAYRRKQFEQLQEEVLDIEDLSGGISITDLTLNDFRMDLARHLKAHQTELEAQPLGMHAAIARNAFGDEEGLKPGVFFCLRSENLSNQRDASYPLAPHYVVYVGADGEVLLNYHQTRRVLELMKKIALGRSQPDLLGAQVFDKQTRNGQNMEAYQALLAKAVAAITGKSEEQGVASLFERGGTALTSESFRGIDDYEVVAWLSVVEGAGAI
ncbi:MAG: DEAD/DEAH box helicase family protein [Planctomycetales bacterium]|nr:DEAD/DEAH box helicase family protein [Planctomycetales bacterium]